MKFKTADIRRYRYIFVGVRVSRISSRPFRNSVENGYGSKSNELHIGANYEDTGTVRSDEEHRFGRDVLAARELGRRGSTIRFVANSFSPARDIHRQNNRVRKVSNEK